MDGDQLTCDGIAVLHAGESDVAVTNLEVLPKVPDHLGMSDAFLLNEEVEMLTPTTGLVQGELLHEKVLVAKLDTTAQIRLGKQPALRKRVEHLIGIRGGEHSSVPRLEIVVFNEGILGTPIIHRAEEGVVGGSLLDDVFGDEDGNVVGDSERDRVGRS